jgi:phage major head subunit gpT-like protein
VEITRGNLRTLGTAFSDRFKAAFGAAPSFYQGVASPVPSTTGRGEYGWLGEVPNVREWLGDRVINALERFSYDIVNKDWELTLGVDRNDIADDNLGIYSTRVDQMGRSTKRHFDQLVFGALNNGFTADCYDGQTFFDTEHPLLDVNGNETSFANTDGGDGTPWFLVAKNQSLLPIILQMRQEYQFVSKAAPNDDNVFFQKKFIYGADARYNVGYGLPQMCWASKNPFDPTHYAAARNGMQSMATDYGQKLGITEFAFYGGPTMEASALQLLNADRNADGSANIYFHTADSNIVPWLT